MNTSGFTATVKLTKQVYNIHLGNTMGCLPLPVSRIVFRGLEHTDEQDCADIPDGQKENTGLTWTPCFDPLMLD